MIFRYTNCQRWLGFIFLLLLLSCSHTFVSNVAADDSRRTDTTRTQPASNGEPIQNDESFRDDKDNNRISLNDALVKAGRRGLNGGKSGAMAGVVQVLTLMWLRTINNHQYRFGTSFRQAFSILYKEGGIARLYQGIGFALVQAPLSRFVSTAANDGVQVLLLNFEATQSWSVAKSTILASIFVGFWRMMLMPLDTCKVVLQVDGREGFRNLIRRIKKGKFWLLYQGAFANALSSALSHYPWFFLYNVLSKNEFVLNTVPSTLLRNGMVGFLCSVISDGLVNSIRVVKTTKQSMGSKHEISYLEATRMILAANGWKGLFLRGLRTRILSNAVNSALFTIIWRGLADRFARQDESNSEAATDGVEKKIKQ